MQCSATTFDPGFGVSTFWTRVQISKRRQPDSSHVIISVRKLCVLIGMKGWSYDEVSEELELPLGSVGPLYIRAKAKMRKLLNASNN